MTQFAHKGDDPGGPQSYFKLYIGKPDIVYKRYEHYERSTNTLDQESMDSDSRQALSRLDTDRNKVDKHILYQTSDLYSGWVPPSAQ